MSRRASVTAVSKNLLCQQMSGQIILQDKQALCHPRFQKAKLPPPWQEAASISKSIYIKLLLRKSKHCSGSMTATLLATSGSLSSWRDEILWFSTTLKYNHFKFFKSELAASKYLKPLLTVLMKKVCLILQGPSVPFLSFLPLRWMLFAERSICIYARPGMGPGIIDVSTMPGVPQHYW